MLLHVLIIQQVYSVVYPLYNYDTGASADEVSSAVRYIQELLAAKVAPRWYQMGVVLGVQVAVLESIRLNNNQAKDSERQMFDAWLENASLPQMPQTWQVLVDAIGHEAGGNHRKLAKTVSKKVSTKPSGIYTVYLLL